MLLYKRPNQRGIQASHRFHLRVQTSAAQAVLDAKTMTLSDDDNNGSVTAAVGDTLVVSLASTPSTGYRWAVTDNVESILKPAGESYVRGSNAPGASGTQVFTFTVAAPGAVSFKMSYQRFNGTVARTWQVFVDVPQP
jgi:predicted secreted protein